MKILYITEQDLNNNSGISQKVRSQSDIWRKANHDVTIINFNSLRGDENSKIRSILPPHISSFLSVWINGYLLLKLTKKEHFDLIYSRSFLWSVFWNLIGQKTPIIFEINGDIDRELKARSYLTYLYNKLTSPMMMLTCRGLVCVSHELSLKYSLLPIPKKVIANGYAEILNCTTKQSSQKLRLVFVGNNQPWHGINKVITLANFFPDFEFNIIGLMTKKENLPNIIYHDQLSQMRVIEIINECDIGISSLALHRIPIYEASPLKSREYLALGLPIIVAYTDTDLDGLELPFILKIPNTENNVIDSLKKIEQFCLKVKNDSALRAKTKDFFMKHLSYAHKEVTRLDFLQSLLKK